MPLLPQPTLQTARLRLRPYTLADADDVERLAGAVEVADTTQNIPHPYPEGMAATWIGLHEEAYAMDDTAIFAIVVRDDGVEDDAVGQLVGTISLRLEMDAKRAELGYWIGVPYWGHGYATEAARKLLAFGFDTLGLHRIHASHLTRNPASGRVMQKAGMTLEGVSRGHAMKHGVFEDLATYGMLCTDPRAW